MKIDRLFVVSLGAITGLASCSSGQGVIPPRGHILRTGGRGAKTEYPDPARG